MRQKKEQNEHKKQNKQITLDLHRAIKNVLTNCK